LESSRVGGRAGNSGSSSLDGHKSVGDVVWGLHPSHALFKCQHTLIQVGQYERSDKLYAALCHKRGNTLTVVPEYYRKAPWGFLGSVLEAAVRCVALRGRMHACLGVGCWGHDHVTPYWAMIVRLCVYAMHDNASASDRPLDHPNTTHPQKHQTPNLPSPQEPPPQTKTKPQKKRTGVLGDFPGGGRVGHRRERGPADGRLLAQGHPGHGPGADRRHQQRRGGCVGGGGGDKGREEERLPF
jgi:hypothetical protein